ncbi:MAG: hypothetical protein V4787_17115 [Pseudomonadota bacterium]
MFRDSRTVASWILCVVLVGCSSVPEKQDLRKVAGGAAEFSIPETLSYRWQSVAVDVHVLAGKYKLEKENRLGRFYLAEAPSLWWQVRDVVHMRLGGIWIPADRNVSPRIYIYEQPQISGRTLPEARARADPRITDLVVNGVMQAPPGVSAVHAGVAGALASVIIDIAARDRIHMLPPPNDAAFIVRIREAAESAK